MNLVLSVARRAVRVCVRLVLPWGWLSWPGPTRHIPNPQTPVSSPRERDTEHWDLGNAFQRERAGWSTCSGWNRDADLLNVDFPNVY